MLGSIDSIAVVYPRRGFETGEYFYDKRMADQSDQERLDVDLYSFRRIYLHRLQQQEKTCSLGQKPLTTTTNLVLGTNKSKHI